MTANRTDGDSTLSWFLSETENARHVDCVNLIRHRISLITELPSFHLCLTHVALVNRILRMTRYSRGSINPEERWSINCI